MSATSVMQSSYRDPPPYISNNQKLQGFLPYSELVGLDGVSLTARQDPPGEEAKLTAGSNQGLEVKSSPQTYCYNFQQPPYFQSSSNAQWYSQPNNSSSPNQSNQYVIQQTVHQQPSAQNRNIESSSSGSAMLDQNLAAGFHSMYLHNGQAHLTQDVNCLLPPPPEYPGNRADMRRSYEVLDKPHPFSGNLSQSSSQPELNRVTSAVVSSASGASSGSTSDRQNPFPNSCRHHEQHDFAAVAERASKMVEILSEENKSLRNELEGYYRKVSKLQKFEIELQNVHVSHESLLKSSLKKEQLEKAMRLRQESEIKRLEDINKQLQEKVHGLEKQLNKRTALDSLKEIISNQEHTIILLTEQNKKLVFERDNFQEQATSLKNDLDNEKTQKALLNEELTAYKNNAATAMEEESEIRMAALQQGSKESEKIISQAQQEKLQFMDEAHKANLQIAHLEARIKSLEAQCAEKDAVMRVLQRRQRSNLSGRNQAAASTDCLSQQSSSETHSRRTSSLSVEDILVQQTLPIYPNENLEAETWQV